MIKKLCCSIVFLLLVVSSIVYAEIKYEIQDIGTLQTRQSQAIAINNQGQILGFYCIDTQVLRFFVREKNGEFHEIDENPLLVYKDISTDQNTNRLMWHFLTDDGKAYGTLTFINSNSNPILFSWDRQNGLINLGPMPGKEVISVNNLGQVLIKEVATSENGQTIQCPAIWETGKIIKLHTLEGNVGGPSLSARGASMNNHGDVVGESVVLITHKNTLYKQTHAAKWVNGVAIDLHHTLPKSQSSYALLINDNGDVYMGGGYLLTQDSNITLVGSGIVKMNSEFIFSQESISTLKGEYCINKHAITKQMIEDRNSPWQHCTYFNGINENGEIIATGTTIYGEQHALLLAPEKKP